VRNAHIYNVDSHVKNMLDYLQSPCESCLLILVAPELDRRSKFYKACEKTAEVVECGDLSQAEIGRWLSSEAEKRGKKVRSDAVDEICRRAGRQLSAVNNALNVVIGFVGAEDTITQKHVATACADVAEEEVWALTDAISKSDTSASLESLRRLLDLGSEPEELLGRINWLLKTAYLVHVGKGVPPAVHPFVAQKVRPLAVKLGDKVRNAMMLVTDAQFNMRSTGSIHELCLELLVLRLAAPMPAKAARRKQ
jgi:DNA polymerase III delta subunit